MQLVFYLKKYSPNLSINFIIAKDILSRDKTMHTYIYIQKCIGLRRHHFLLGICKYLLKTYSSCTNLDLVKRILDSLRKLLIKLETILNKFEKILEKLEQNLDKIRKNWPICLCNWKTQIDKIMHTCIYTHTYFGF